MKELTNRQEEFLLFFSTLQGSKKCISDASKQFQVTKATVFNIVEILEKLEFIEKGGGGEILFTQAGLEYIKPKLEICKILERWLESDLGLPPITAEFEARKMLVTLEKNTIESLIENILENHNKNQKNIKESNFKLLNNGDYEISFSVYKTDKKNISMGDKGFAKPAILKKTNDLVNLFLYAHNLKYVSKKRNRLQGSLDRLWYSENDKWYEVDVSTDGCYVIPEEALVFNKEDNVCELKIRARATVGNLKMPESEAIIIFDLEELFKKENL